MLNSARLLLPAALSWLMFSPSALGEEPPAAGARSATVPGARPASEVVAEHLARAVRARRAGRWAEAESAYRAAWELEPRPDIAGELGLCEIVAGKFRDGAEHLQMGLEASDTLSPDQQRRFAAAQRAAEKEVGILAISVNPPGARVFVDGRQTGAPQLTYLVFVEAGSHTVRATKAGYQDIEFAIEVARGSSYPVGLRLREIPPSPPPLPAPAPAPCPTRGRCEPHPVEPLRTIGFFTAGAGTVFSVGMMIAAEALQGEVNERSAALGPTACNEGGGPPACEGLQRANDTRDLLSRMGTAGLTLTAGVGLATVASFWLWPSREQEPAGVRVLPATAQNQIGVVLDGQW